MTKYEKAIYKLINNSYNHMNASEIFKALKKDYPSVVLATIYNNLNRLVDDGLIKRIKTNGLPDRFDRSLRHDHLVCENCGELIDVEFKDISDVIKEKIGEDYLYYDLKVHYLCHNCKEKLEVKK